MVIHGKEASGQSGHLLTGVGVVKLHPYIVN